MTRPTRSSRWRNHLRRFLATAAVTALATVGLVLGAAPAQADVQPNTVQPLAVSCYYGAYRAIGEAEFTLKKGDTVVSYFRMDGQRNSDVSTWVADRHGGLGLSQPTYFIDNDDATHFFEWVVNDTVLASGSFSYLTSCNPKPIPATASFGMPVCTDSTATAPLDIAHTQGVSPKFIVTTESVDGTKTYTGSSQDQMGQVHFDIELARTGTTTVTVTERYRPTLTTPIDEHTYTLPADCNLPTPTPTPTPTSTPTTEPTSTPMPTATPTDTPSPSPSESSSPLSLSLSVSTVIRGSQITVTATGFAPEETVEIWLHSTPIKLVTATADQNGTVHQTVTIPVDSAIGPHKIEVRGASSGSVYANLSVTDGLAVTGLDSSTTVATGVGASMLLLGGIALVLATRRRPARRS